MSVSISRISQGLFVFLFAIRCFAATFGTVVPIRGTVSDIALDERHGQLYAANFSAGQIEVMRTADRSMLAPMPVPKPPSSVAMSPDNRFLLVGEAAPPDQGEGGVTIFDLDANSRRDVAIDGSVLAVAFGAGTSALMVTTEGFFQIEPFSARVTPINLTSLSSMNLPVPLATFPPQIIQASAAASGDGKMIIVLASAGATDSTSSDSTSSAGNGLSVVARYNVQSGSLAVEVFTASPPLGPRVVSVDQDGTNSIAGWGLLHHIDQDYLWAQFPAAQGAFNIGSHAWDIGRNVIYAQIPAPGDGPVLHVVDTDNLTVRERIQLPQNLSGRSIISSDDQTMYSVSVSGVTVLPIGQLSQAPQVGTLEEDLLFQGDACNREVITKTLDIVDLGNAGADFTLSVPSGTKGVRILTATGTAPATVQIQVDPVVFQNVKGTTVIPLTITTSAGINLPFPVRLLINTRDFDQRGTIVDVPGKIVDLLADRVRNRIYMLRQDKNLVLVYDSTTLKQIASMRTGNTPVGMSITTDQRYLIVGNDNSQIASVFDLETLSPSNPILFPFGHYPRSIGVALTDIFATVRPVGGSPTIDRIDFARRVANTPASLGIYKNVLPSADGVLAESPGNQTLFLALPDGNVMLYDTSVATWVDSRKDFTSLGGAYGALGGNMFLADTHLFDEALVPIGELPPGSGSSSGTGMAQGLGLRTTAVSASGPGMIERVDLTNLQAFHETALAEAPVMSSSLKTPTVGQIGETILPFTRALAMPPDQSSILLLSVSGLTTLAPDFDAITQIPVISSVTNAADGTTTVAPGGLVQISGNGLAPASMAASGTPLPSALGDACVTVNNVALPLFSVSPSQVMAQLPFVTAGAATVLVRNPSGVSAAYPFTIQSEAPAIFRSGSAGSLTGLATVIRDDNQDFVTFTNPIHPGLGITIYLTGMGTTTPLPVLGDAAPSDPLAFVTSPPAVTLGGKNLSIAYAGLVPGEVGVYQIDATVPDHVEEGTNVPLTITQQTQSTTLSVRVVNP